MIKFNVNDIITHHPSGRRFTGHWDDINNQRSFLNNLAKKLNINDLSGWYKITQYILEEQGGGGLVRKYNGSPSKLLQTVYPEYLLMELYKLVVILSSSYHD